MYRGTTPTLYFKINNIEDLDTIKEINIVFKNTDGCHCVKDNGEKLIKKLNDVTIDNEEKIISLTLTQKETLSLHAPSVLTQIKIMFQDGTVCASSICEVPVEEPLDAHLMKIEIDEPNNTNPSPGTPGEDIEQPTPTPGTDNEEESTPNEEESNSESEDASGEESPTPEENTGESVNEEGE